MSKKPIQSRKFLEEQVKFMLNEIDGGDPTTIDGKLTMKRSHLTKAQKDKNKNSLEKAPEEIIKGLYEPFVVIGNRIFNKLYGGNLEQALGSLNYDKEAGSKKNFEDLKSVKDFFVLFSEPNLSDQQLGLNSMGDYLDPKFAKPSKYLKKYVSFINTKLVPKWNQVKKNENQRFSKELYEKLYRSIYSSAPKTSGTGIPMRFGTAGSYSTITDKKTLEEKNFFIIAAKTRMPFAQFALLCLRPFQELISSISNMYGEDQLTTVRELSSQNNITELLSSYKDYFVGSLNSEDKEILRNTFLAFSVAKMVDPSGNTPLSKWYQIVSKDPPNMKIGGKSIGYYVAYFRSWIALSLAEWNALKMLLQRIRKKKTNLFSWPMLLIMGIQLIDPLKYLDTGSPISLPDSVNVLKGKIPGAIDKTLKVINDIEKTKPKDGDWFFTAEENETWRREFSEIEKILKNELESGGVTKVMDSAAEKYKTWKDIQGSYKEMFTLMRMYLQLEINKDNIEANKQALKESKSGIIDFYNRVRVPADSLFETKVANTGSGITEPMKTTIINRKQLSSIVSETLLEKDENEETELEKQKEEEKKKKEAEAIEKAKKTQMDAEIAAAQAAAYDEVKNRKDDDLYTFLAHGLFAFGKKHIKIVKGDLDGVKFSFGKINQSLIKGYGLTASNVSDKSVAAQGLWKKAVGAEKKLTIKTLNAQFFEKYEQIFPTSARDSLAAKHKTYDDFEVGRRGSEIALFAPGKDGFTPAITQVGLYHEINSFDSLKAVTQASFPVYSYFAPRLYKGEPKTSVFILTSDPGEAAEIMLFQSLHPSQFENTQGSASKTMRIDTFDKLFQTSLSDQAILIREQYEQAVMSGEGFKLSDYVENYKTLSNSAANDNVEKQYITAMYDYVNFLAEMVATADYLGKLSNANKAVAEILDQEASKPTEIVSKQQNEQVAAATMMVQLEKLSIIDKQLKSKGLKLHLDKKLVNNLSK